VAYIWAPTAPGAYISARVASFAGWGAWPPHAPVIADVQHTRTGLPLSGVSLIAQSNPSTKPPSLDLLYAQKPQEDDNFGTDPIPVGGLGLDGSTPLVQGPNKGRALFLANGGTPSDQTWPGNVNLLSGVNGIPLNGAPPYILRVEAGANFGGPF